MFLASLPDPSTVLPIGGASALFFFMLKMMWSDNSTRRTVEAELRKEWAEDRDRLEAMYTVRITQMTEDYGMRLAAMTRIHDAEIASMNRRIEALEADNERLKAS